MEQFDSFNGHIEELSQPDRFTYEVCIVTYVRWHIPHRKSQFTNLSGLLCNIFSLITMTQTF